MDDIGGYGGSLELDTNDKGCTRQWKDGEMVRSARIEEKGTTSRRLDRGMQKDREWEMNGFGDDKMEIGLEWGGWKDGHNMVSKEYSAPRYMLFKRRFYKGCDRIGWRFG